VEIFTRVLARYLVPRHKIDKLSRELKAGGYERLRAQNIETVLLKDLKVPDVEISNLKLDPRSPLAGRTPAEMNLRRAFGVTLLALARNEKVMANPDPEETIQGGDGLIVMGSTEDITRFAVEVGGPLEENEEREP
jgi:CPA2 family monovalent cation:H+ antiporter-2